MNPERRFERLVSLIRDPAVGQDFSEKIWEETVHVLRESDLLGTLCHLAQEHGVLSSYSAYAQRHLVAMQVYSQRQARQVAYECELINQSLLNVGIRPVFLKGAGYTLRKSRNSFGRIYGDIDVLVAKEHIDSAQAVMRKDAWYSPPISDYDQRYYRRWAHELPPMKHLTRRTVLDLHHNIVPPVGGRAPDIKKFLRDTVTTGNGTLVLSTPAAVLHSLVHLFNNEDLSSGFRDLIDVYLLLTEFGDTDFWNALLSLGEETGFMPELAYGVALLDRILSYKAPSDVCRRMEKLFNNASNSFLIKQVLAPALRPHHPAVCDRRARWAIQMAYIRGHWIKMPLHILVAHLSIKAWLAISDKMFGKYRSAPVLE